MKKVLFICHGNICRSPMAEFIFKDLIRKRGMQDEFVVESMATTNDDLSSDTYYLAKQQLGKHGIPYSPRRARKFRREDYDRFDHIYVMDEENLQELSWILPSDPQHKVEKLLGYSDVPDPWYTRNFDLAYVQIYQGCRQRLDELMR